MYDLEKVETLKYLDLSKSKWRSVEARIKATFQMQLFYYWLPL